MYIKDGIAYAGEAEEILSVKRIESMEGYLLKLLFSNGETRVYDFKQMLAYPVFRPLEALSVFNHAYLDHGTVTWNDEIDIASETLYEGGVPV
jgi:hypothetical protein